MAIFDKQNMFFDGAEASSVGSGAASAALTNGAGGDANDALFLYGGLYGADSGSITFNLETADDKAFASPVTLASFTAKAGKPIRAKLPAGGKKFYRLKGASSSASAGTVTMGLVLDADLLGKGYAD